MKEFFVLIWIGMSVAVFADVLATHSEEHRRSTTVVVGMTVAVFAPAVIGFRLLRATASGSDAKDCRTANPNSRIVRLVAEPAHD